MDLGALRAWADEVATSTSSRRLARRVGMSVEGLRQFIRGDTRPQERTLRRLGEAYLADLREQRAREAAAERPDRVAEPPAAYAAGLAEELRGALPPTRGEAVRWVGAFFAAVRRHADDFPPGAAELEASLLRCAERLPGDPPGRRGGAQRGSPP